MRSAQVGVFRTNVEEAVERFRRPSRPGKQLRVHHGVTVGDREYFAVNRNQRRPNTIAMHGERQWAVVLPRQSIEQGLATLAIFSVSEKPGSLYRKWSFDHNTVRTQRHILRPTDLALLADWSVAGSDIELPVNILALTEAEINSVTEQRRQRREASEQLRARMDDMANCRAVALIDIPSQSLGGNV